MGCQYSHFTVLKAILTEREVELGERGGDEPLGLHFEHQVVVPRGGAHQEAAGLLPPLRGDGGRHVLLPVHMHYHPLVLVQPWEEGTADGIN